MDDSRYAVRQLQLGCPCPFSSPTTHGHCEAIEAGHIDEGEYDGTRLDGLNYLMLVQWPTPSSPRVPSPLGAWNPLSDHGPNLLQRQRDLLIRKSTLSQGLIFPF